MYEINEELEAQQIQITFDHLLESCHKNKQLTQKEEDDILRAFSIANKAHTGTRRKSGEPYIFHPLAVAQIAVEEVGLGSIAVICALLHDVVEDTEITLDELRAVFGDRVARIVDGVTKIDDVMKLQQTTSKQAENFKKIMLAMCDDPYVIFLKLCDRLHNMRTLGSMKDTKKLAISSETQYFYIPLAHRLGLYAIKTELEELVMKYTNPTKYAELSEKIKSASSNEQQIRDCLIIPICNILDDHGFSYRIKFRIKSVYSCWKKMENKSVDFDEIYDLFAMRIILNVPLEKEKEECFKVYALISQQFKPNPNRFRDWITTPKNNGYESLQTTVMSPVGRWVEIQIRTSRMDEVAEKGMAAHFLYKEMHPDDTRENTEVEEWLKQIRETLENSEKSAIDLVEEFKETLYTKEIYVFTPKGKTVNLRAHSTVLDFAFAIHTDLGLSCIGAKVNSKVVPINYVLHSGEQVQVLTSKKTKPTEEWLDYVRTSRAKEHLKDFIRNQKKGYYEQGRNLYDGFLSQIKVPNTTETLTKLKQSFGLKDEIDLFYQLAIGKRTLEEFKEVLGVKKNDPQMFFLGPFKKYFESSSDKDIKSPSTLNNTSHQSNTKYSFLNLQFDEAYSNLESEPASCCKPVQGDDVVGIIHEGKIQVHRTNCKNVLNELAVHENNVVKAKWRSGEKISFLSGVTLSAIDRKGLLQELTKIISEEMDLNMRSITLETSEGVVNGVITLYVQNVENLNHLMDSIAKLEGVENVKRI